MPNYHELWNDYAINIPVIVFSVYAAYKLMSIFFGKKKPQEEDCGHVEDSSSIDDTNWLNNLSGKELIAFKESVYYNKSPSSPTNEDSNYQSALNCGNLIRQQIEEAYLSEKFVGKTKKKLLEPKEILSYERTVGKFAIVTVKRLDSKGASALDVSKAAREATTRCISEAEGDLSKDLIAAGMSDIVNTITDEVQILDGSRKHRQAKACGSRKELVASGVGVKILTEEYEIAEKDIQNDFQYSQKNTTDKMGTKLEILKKSPKILQKFKDKVVTGIAIENAPAIAVIETAVEVSTEVDNAQDAPIIETALEVFPDIKNPQNIPINDTALEVSSDMKNTQAISFTETALEVSFDVKDVQDVPYIKTASDVSSEVENAKGIPVINSALKVYPGIESAPLIRTIAEESLEVVNEQNDLIIETALEVFPGMENAQDIPLIETVVEVCSDMKKAQVSSLTETPLEVSLGMNDPQDVSLIDNALEVSPNSENAEQVLPNMTITQDKPFIENALEVFPDMEIARDIPLIETAVEVSPDMKNTDNTLFESAIEVTPRVEAAPDISPKNAQNYEDLNNLLSTAKFYESNFTDIPLEMIYNTLPSLFR